MGRRRRQLVSLLILVLCLLALAWAIHGLGPGRVWEAVTHADPFWLGLSAAAVAGRFLIWGAKWKLMLGRREEVPYGPCLRAILAGAFVNLTTPTAKLAGGVVRAAMIARRRSWPRLDAYGWALADQTTNVLGQWLLYGVVGVTAFSSLPSGRLRVGLLVSGLAVVAGVLVLGTLRGRLWSLSQRPEIGRLIARMVPGRFRPRDAEETVTGWLGRILRPLLRHGGMLTTFLPDVLLAAVGFSTMCLSNALVLRALGAEIPLILVAVAVMGGYLAGTVVGAWGGIGVTEAALTGLFVQFGVPLEIAATAALLHRAVFYTLVLAGGGPVLMAETRARRGSRHPAATVRGSFAEVAEPAFASVVEEDKSS
jgi:uncharacterized protein (TIRG00374 family)